MRNDLPTYTKEENTEASRCVDGQHQLVAINTVLKLPHAWGKIKDVKQRKVQKRRGGCKDILYIYKLLHEYGEMRKKEVKKRLTISSIQGQGKHYTQKVTPNITTPACVRVGVGGWVSASHSLCIRFTHTRTYDDVYGFADPS